MADKRDWKRRPAAKRWNERVKLFASFMNTLSVAAVGTGALYPLINLGVWHLSAANAAWMLLGLTLHFIAQAAFRLLRSED